MTRLAAGVAAAWLVLGAGAAGADWKEVHRLGVAAVEDGRWADAARFFRAAIAERPEEKVSRFLKNEYLPHYYLGVALAEQGDCRSALISWEQSLRQAQIDKSERAADLERRRGRCQAHLRQVDAAVAEVEALLARAGKAAESLAALARQRQLAALWDLGETSFGGRQRAAAGRLAEAGQRLAEGRAATDLGLLDAAKSLASQTLSDLEATDHAARERLRELERATRSAREQLEDAERNGRRALAAVHDLAPLPGLLAARVAALKRLLQTVTDGKDKAGAQVLADLTGELGAAVDALERAARRPPARLAAAAEVFLRGAYEEALGLLADEKLTRDSRARPHACLLRAATRHALWALGGEADAALLDLAARDLTECAGADALIPSPRFFSPRFLEFHQATLKALVEEPATAPTAGGSPETEPASAGERG